MINSILNMDLGIYKYRLLHRIAPILLLVLAFFFAAGLYDCVWADDSWTDERGMTFYYMTSGTEDDRYAVITGCDRESVPEDGVASVPSEIDGYPVREIGSNAFKAVEPIHSISVPESVERIGEKAFWCAESLTEVELSEGLRSIGQSAFDETSITEISFPSSLESIGPLAFFQCNKLGNIYIKGGNLSIAADAFSYCQRLDAFHVDESCETYTAVDGVLFSKDMSVLVVYPHRWQGMSPAEYVIPAGTKSISDYAFQFTQGLESIVMTDIESIGTCAFEYCSNLKSVTLPSGLKTIGTGVFSGCSNINDVNIPAGLTVIPSDAFAGCGRISAYNVQEGNKNYASEEGVLYDAGFRKLLKYPAARSDAEYTVPDGVTEISDYAFNKADCLESVKLPGSVSSIGSYAFAECYGLRTINMPEELVSIGEHAFEHCSNLGIAVNIPDKVRSIGPNAFAYTGVVSADIPASVSEIDEYTFFLCRSLEKVTMSRKGIVRIGDSAFGQCGKLREITISETASDINDSVLVNSGSELPEGTRLVILGYNGSPAQKYAKEHGIEFRLAAPLKEQKVNVRTSVKCTYGTKPFALGATAATPMTYTSSNAKVAVADKTGKIIITGIGTATITITAKETNEYTSASATVKIKSIPAKVSLKAKNIKKKKVKLVWARVKGADGYEVYIKSPGGKFKKRVTKKANVKSITHSRLSKGKTYAYKVRAFKKINGKKVYGAFSKVRKVKIRK